MSKKQPTAEEKALKRIKKTLALVQSGELSLDTESTTKTFPSLLGDSTLEAIAKDLAITPEEMKQLNAPSEVEKNFEDTLKNVLELTPEEPAKNPETHDLKAIVTEAVASATSPLQEQLDRQAEIIKQLQDNKGARPATSNKQTSTLKQAMVGLFVLGLGAGTYYAHQKGFLRDGACWALNNKPITNTFNALFDESILQAHKVSLNCPEP